MFHKTKLQYDGKQTFESSTYSGFYAGPTHEPKGSMLPTDWNVQGCRDGIGGVMREAINEGKLETDKLRLLFVWQNYAHEVAESWCLRGLRCIQACEKLAGWPLTRAVKVDMPHDNYAVYVRGSRRWLKTPYYVTLYILLMRMCVDTKFNGFKNFDGLEKIVLNNTSWERDGRHIETTKKYWRALMLGYPYMFEQFKMTYYWDSARLTSGSGYGEGIYKLCEGETRFTDARTNLRLVYDDIKKNGKLTLKRNKKKKKS